MPLWSLSLMTAYPLNNWRHTYSKPRLTTCIRIHTLLLSSHGLL